MTHLFITLLAAGAFGAALGVAIITAVKKRRRATWLARLGGIVISALYGAALIGAYMAALIGASMVLGQLGVNEGNYLCEVDCQIAYSAGHTAAFWQIIEVAS
jgi:hypothetical protein